MTYKDIKKHLKIKRGEMECCKNDCKDKECYKGKYCIDLDIANDLIITKLLKGE